CGTDENCDAPTQHISRTAEFSPCELAQPWRFALGPNSLPTPGNWSTLRMRMQCRPASAIAARKRGGRDVSQSDFDALAAKLHLLRLDIAAENFNSERPRFTRPFFHALVGFNRQ